MQSAWGPNAWKFLHAVSFAYASSPTPEEERLYRSFVHKFVSVLPCEECRAHGLKYLEKHPPDTGSKESFSRWCVSFHNHVNKTTGKPYLSYEKVKKAYEESPNSYPPSLLLVTGVALFIAACSVLIYFSCKRKAKKES